MIKTSYNKKVDISGTIVSGIIQHTKLWLKTDLNTVYTAIEQCPVPFAMEGILYYDKTYSSVHFARQACCSKQ